MVGSNHCIEGCLHQSEAARRTRRLEYRCYREGGGGDGRCISIDLSSTEGTQVEGVLTTAAVTSGSSSTVDSESGHGELGHGESDHSTGLSS